MSAEIG